MKRAFTVMAAVLFALAFHTRGFGQNHDPHDTGHDSHDPHEATIRVGTTTTVPAGTPASVTDSGTPTAAVLNFKIPQGPAGPQGPQGPQGPRGIAGPAGPSGSQGPQGVPGPTGATGATGAAGATGAQGPAGVTGPQGPQGVAGPAGPAGPTGPTGPQGPAGPAGTSLAPTVATVSDALTLAVDFSTGPSGPIFEDLGGPSVTVTNNTGAPEQALVTISAGVQGGFANCLAGYLENSQVTNGGVTGIGNVPPTENTAAYLGATDSEFLGTVSFTKFLSLPTGGTFTFTLMYAAAPLAGATSANTCQFTNSQIVIQQF